ncbi:hypothetical protein V8C26DRAFT_350985 [Trichoderma gracile]
MCVLGNALASMSSDHAVLVRLLPLPCLALHIEQLCVLIWESIACDHVRHQFRGRASPRTKAEPHQMLAAGWV